jgi:hypothetical protein
MKKLLLLSMVTFITMTNYSQTTVGSPHESSFGKNVTVRYGRPYKKDRVIFGELEKYGMVWRCGADSATTITFKKGGFFGGKPVKAGTYTLFAIPNKKDWTIILNSVLGQWGAYKYEENKGKDVLQIKVPVKNLDRVVEQLTIRFTAQNNMIIEWDRTQVEVPIKI